MILMTLTALMTAMIQTMMKTNQDSDIKKGPVLLLVAAGSSSRMGGIKKEYLPLDGGTVLSTAAGAFLNTLKFSLVAVTYPFKTSPEELKKSEELCQKALFAGDSFEEAKKIGTDFIFVPGGKSRQESVFNALLQIKNTLKDGEDPLIFIHDGARPFVSSALIQSCFDAAIKYNAAVPALEPVDTQKEIDGKGFIARHLVRSSLAAVQTPQVFKFQPLLKAHEKARLSDKEYTDDTEIWDLFAEEKPVKVVKGESTNKKITWPDDIKTQNPQTDNHTKAQPQKGTGDSRMIRTGLGYDKHALVSGRKLMLGGIEIESDLGEDGHSDGDVLLHAVTDALLGAAGMGDIGSFFPPEEAKWKDADSKVLLKTVWDKITEKGFKLGNLDCVIALEKPKFLPHRQKVIKSIAEVLGVKEEQIFVKAKTGEKLGDIGQRRAVEVWASCLLEK